MILPILHCLLLGVALAKPGPLTQGPEPRDGGIQIQPRQLDLSRQLSVVTLSAGEYVLTSPGFPNNYPNDFRAGVDIRGDEGQEVTLCCNNDDFDVQPHDTCRRDFLRINGIRYCNSRPPPDAVTSTRVVALLKTNSRRTFGGFRCDLSVAEGNTTTTEPPTEGPTGGPTEPPTEEDQCCGIARRVQRIVGGMATDANEYPWQVALASPFSNRPFCGGTIINTEWVLTAAHCVDGDTAGDFGVLIGKHNLLSDPNQQRINVAEIIVHPEYNSVTFSNDFALVRLVTSLDFSEEHNLAAPACLPEAGNDFANVNAVVSGWGTTSSGGSQPDFLNEVVVQTLTNAECGATSLNAGSILPNMICAGVDGGGRDSCQGDSGGPLVTEGDDGRFTLIGVVSWGIGCALDGFPGVYARVTSVLDWIDNTTDGASTCGAA